MSTEYEVNLEQKRSQWNDNNPLNATCVKLLLFEAFSAILV